MNNYVIMSVLGTPTSPSAGIRMVAAAMSFRFKSPVYLGETVTCHWVITSIDQSGRAAASVTLAKENGVTVVEAEISGIVPGVEGRKVLSQMLSEGDPTNELTNTPQNRTAKDGI